MKKGLMSLVSGFCILSLVGCAGTNNQEVGTLGGGVIGGLVGNHFGSGSGRVFATLAGTAIGAYVGNNIGRSMDEGDRRKMNQVFENNRSEQASSWHNPDSGASYTVIPQRTYYNEYKQPCREYTSTAIIGGKRQEIYGHACRTPGGAWKIID